MKNLKDNIKSFKINVLNNKVFVFFVLLFTIVAYGYNMFNTTISMDDMAFFTFAGDIHYAVKIMRWGIYLLYPFIGTAEFSPGINSLFAVILLQIAAILLCFLFYSLNGKKNNIYLYTVLASLFITYPLINEIWCCSAMSVNICYNGISFYMCLALLALVYLYYVDVFTIKSVIISGLFMSPVMAGYESVVFFYITVVLIIIYYKNYQKEYNKKNDWFFDGIRYALPLIIALFVRIAVGNVLIMIYNVEPASSLGRSAWLSKSFKEIIIQILYNGWYYLIRGLSYFPIGEFVIALVIFVIITIIDSKNNSFNLLLGLFVILSVFLLSVVQGDYLYYRLAQTVQLFVAYVGYLLVDRFEGTVNKVFIILLLFICLRQSICLHTYLTLNNQRSNNEAFIAQTIGSKLYSEFDTSKTIIFCGEYQLGNFIEDQITIDDDKLGGKVENSLRKLLGVEKSREYEEYISNNINSYFNKQMDAFNGQTMLQRYLAYYGYDIKVLENLSDEEEDKLKGYYELIAKENNMKPYQIKDMGDYILVYLGPTIDAKSKLKYN